MKRMDKVFDLPIETSMLVRDIAYGLLDTADESAITHAINHVDSLADALEDLMDWNVKNVWVDEHPAYDRAAKALAKYRGDK